METTSAIEKDYYNGYLERSRVYGMYIAMSERDLRMGEWNNRRQWNMEVGRRRQTF